MLFINPGLDSLLVHFLMLPYASSQEHPPHSSPGVPHSRARQGEQEGSGGSPLFFLLISAPLPSTLAISPHHAWNASAGGKAASPPPYPPGFAVWHKIDLEQKALDYRSFSSCKAIQGRPRSLSPTTCIMNPASYVDLILQHPPSWLLPVTA